jgi:hypothetical protein
MPEEQYRCWVHGEPSKPGWYWIICFDDSKKSSSLFTDISAEYIVIVNSDGNRLRAHTRRDGIISVKPLPDTVWHCPCLMPHNLISEKMPKNEWETLLDG